VQWRRNLTAALDGSWKVSERPFERLKRFTVASPLPVKRKSPSGRRQKMCFA
jgi:hypothetical protein